MEDYRFLAEIISMSRIYVRHNRFELARKLLRECLTVEERAASPRPYVMAIALYTLGEVYSDHGNYVLASDLQHQAATYWQSRKRNESLDLLWYSSVLTELEDEIDKLLHRYSTETNRRSDIA